MTPGAILLLILGGASAGAPVIPTRAITVHGRDQSDPTTHATQGGTPTVHGRDQSDPTAHGS